MMGMSIGLEFENDHCIYEFVLDHLPIGLAILTTLVDYSILWHQLLGHPDISKLFLVHPIVIISFLSLTHVS